MSFQIFKGMTVSDGFVGEYPLGALGKLRRTFTDRSFREHQTHKEELKGLNTADCYNISLVEASFYLGRPQYKEYK